MKPTTTRVFPMTASVALYRRAAGSRTPLSPPKAIHTFAQNELEVIREAGRVLRERTPEEDFELEGLVIDVGRPSAPLRGSAVILGLV